MVQIAFINGEGISIDAGLLAELLHRVEEAKGLVRVDGAAGTEYVNPAHILRIYSDESA